MLETSGQLRLAEQISGVAHWRLSLPDRRLHGPSELFRLFGLDPAADAPDMEAMLAACHPDDRQRVRETLERSIARLSDLSLRTRVLWPDGQIRHVEMRGVAEQGRGGVLTGLTGAVMDVTEHRVAEDMRAELRALGIRAQAAMDASRAKSNFLANMSHELRTPLNGMLGYAELLRLDGGLTGEQAARVQVMVEAGTHLLKMINRVLDLSEIENGVVEIRTAETDLRGLCDACFDLMLPAAADRGVTLRLTVAPDVPVVVMADPTRLRQVLDNLLGNAVRFSDEGTVELRLLLAPGEPGLLRCEVIDSGPGLSPERRRHICADFDRPDSAALTASEGVGLGLSISSRLVALMGGRIGHEPHPGGGSLFWLELPLLVRPAAAAAQAGSGTADPPAAPGRRLRLMVVDDVALNRDVAEAFLIAAGHDVVCVESGAAAIRTAAAADFDAVLMDVRMPGMDGLEATRKIRALPGSRGEVPVIALTAQAFSDQVEACRLAGMAIHLSKPITQAALLAAVNQATDPALAPQPVQTTD